MTSKRLTAESTLPPPLPSTALAHSPLLGVLLQLATRLLEAADLECVLIEIASAAIDVVPAAELASVTMLNDADEPFTPCCTEDLATELDVLQYTSLDGPCLEVVNAQTWHSVRSGDLLSETRWRAFSPAAAELGVRSVLSTTLFTADGLASVNSAAVMGSLNLYARGPAAFTDPDQDVALLLSLYAAMALNTALTRSDAARQTEDFKAALASRTVIGQAQGILMERHKVNASQAFDRLRIASQHLNRKLRLVAQRISETGQEPLDGDGRIHWQDAGDKPELDA